MDKTENLRGQNPMRDWVQNWVDCSSIYMQNIWNCTEQSDKKLSRKSLKAERTFYYPAWEDEHYKQYLWEGRDFSGSTVVKNLPANAGDTRDVSLHPGSGGSLGIPLQYSCLENFMDRGAWWATVHGVAKSWTWLGSCACIHMSRKGSVITPTIR